MINKYKGATDLKRILFMLGGYYPNPSPNGICVHRVSGELTKLGYQIHVIAHRGKNENFQEYYEGISIHRINKRLDEKLLEYGKRKDGRTLGKISYKAAGVVRKILKLVFIPWFPLASPFAVYRYYKKAYSLNKKHRLDCIIAVFNPDEPLFAGALLKKQLKEVKYGAYILDSLIYLSGQNYLPSGLRNKLSWKFEKMVYETADRVYNMECHRLHHQSEKYLPYKNKMVFLDTPLYSPRRPFLSNKLYDSNIKHLVYMGSLFKDFRNPNYLYRLFKEINKSGEFQLHFYTRGSCEDELLKYQAESNGTVIKHGFVSHNEIDNIMANSDFLINIGVSNSTAISSKIFDYMSTGKPIIHLYYLDDDVNLNYFLKYELCLTIKMDEKIFNENANRLKEFLNKTHGKIIKQGELLETFKKNYPMCTAKHFDALARGNQIEN